MPIEPLHCLGAILMTERTMRKDEEPIWKKSLLGIMTGFGIAAVSGMASGFIASYVSLNEHSVKIDAIMERVSEDRALVREELREVRARLRDIEARRR
jgi:hypothetical protein